MKKMKGMPAVMLWLFIGLILAVVVFTIILVVMGKFDI